MATSRKKTISTLTKALLAEGETERADFKRTPDGVSTDDLVGFANVDKGGSILVGVDEDTGAGGAQIGIVRGCDVGDATILQITNKALSCIPPIAIRIHIENMSAAPFLRIEVPPSGTKPHCTPKGIYCRRDGSRNRPLHPEELLQIFLNSEARAFAQKFEAAADRITQDLSELEASLDGSIQAMANQLGWADSKLDDTESSLGAILGYAKKLNDEASDISTRLRALFKQDKRDDPVRAKAREELLEALVKRISEDPDLLKNIRAGGSVSMTTAGRAAIELDKNDLHDVLFEAVKLVIERTAAAKNKTTSGTVKTDAAGSADRG